MSIQVRPATAADIPAITAIYADAVIHGTATYELKPPSAEDMEQRRQNLTEAGYPYLLAEEEGRILAYAYAGPFRARAAYRFMAEDSIYVAPDAKGRGLGRLLLSRLIEECTVHGFRQIVAVIGDGHPASPSVILHEKLGFRPSGMLEGSGFKHGRWLDTMFMQLTLNQGRSAPPDPDSTPERRFRGEGMREK